MCIRDRPRPSSRCRTRACTRSGAFAESRRARPPATSTVPSSRRPERSSVSRKGLPPAPAARASRSGWGTAPSTSAATSATTSSGSGPSSTRTAPCFSRQRKRRSASTLRPLRDPGALRAPGVHEPVEVLDGDGAGPGRLRAGGGPVTVQRASSHTTGSELSSQCSVRSAASVAGSAHWRSSRPTSTGRVAVQLFSRTRSCSTSWIRGSSSSLRRAWAGGSSRAMNSGASGMNSSSSSAPPVTGRNPCREAWEAASASSRLLPVPGSPSTSRVPPRPSPAALRRWMKVCHSDSRPRMSPPVTGLRPRRGSSTCRMGGPAQPVAAALHSGSPASNHSTHGRGKASRTGRHPQFG